MTRIKLLFSVFGDFINLEEFEKIINVSSTTFWQKGDPVSHRKNGLVRQEACWEYSFGFSNNSNLDELTKKFVEVIEPNHFLLECFIKENNLQSKVYLVVEIMNDEKPCLFIGKNFMEILVRMNGELDIDLYNIEE
jgi:hypothetical protein